jgi:GTP-binding protein Era
MANSPFRAGYVAIVGRPNVGKSTLLNALVGEKLSIVTAKAHTTRHRLLGALNHENFQAIFIDTPGHARRTAKALHRMMARTYRQAVDDADLVFLVVEARGLKRDDHALIEALADIRDRTILVINKIDQLQQRSRLLPFLEDLKRHNFLAYVPICATRADALGGLIEALVANLPEGPPLFPLDFTTDKDMRFRAAELIREKLFNQLHQEIPYGLTVEIEAMRRSDGGRWEFNAIIWIERESHKPIVIGKAGRVLKSVGRDARLELSEILSERVHLELWIKIREHWSDNVHELIRLGYD